MSSPVFLFPKTYKSECSHSRKSLFSLTTKLLAGRRSPPLPEAFPPPPPFVFRSTPPTRRLWSFPHTRLHSPALFPRTFLPFTVLPPPPPYTSLCCLETEAIQCGSIASSSGPAAVSFTLSRKMNLEHCPLVLLPPRTRTFSPIRMKVSSNPPSLPPCAS